MIIRAGEIGKILIQILKASGVNVVATSRTQRKLEKAKDLGADLVLQQNLIVKSLKRSNNFLEKIEYNVFSVVLVHPLP